MMRTNSRYVRGLLTFIALIISIGLGKQASASIEINDQEVFENPNNTISAVYSIHGSGISSAYIEYMCLDCDEREESDPEWERTPTFAVEFERFILPVLGLLPDSAYTMRAVLIDSLGSQIVTDPLPFGTGSLPDALDIPFNPTYTIPSVGYVLISQSSTFSQARGYVIALDKECRIAWYVQIQNSRIQSLVSISDMQTIMIHVVRNDGSMRYYEIDLFGNIVALHKVPMYPSEEDLGLDNHEFLHLMNGEKIFMCRKHYILDMTPYGGPTNATVMSNRVRRVSTDGEIVFDWGYMDTFPLTDTQEPLDGPIVDWVHANSIDIDEDGNYILSSRSFSEVTKISSQDGSVIWRLGGKNNQFTFVGDNLGGFSQQHAARDLGDGHLLLFDNGRDHCIKQSRAVEYRLDLNDMTATLVWDYRYNPVIYAQALSNAQRLPGGNTLINYASLYSGRPRIIEVSPSGERLWELKMPFDYSGSGCYRAFKLESLYFGTNRVPEYQDLDGDGWFGYFDCNEQDPQIHPGVGDLCDGIDQDCNGFDGVDEIPDNGIDDNCNGRIDESEGCFVGVVM
ncbi:aryl-sulfate sulfotransferase [Thermodesulfobacteriota bacterium]